MTLREFVKRKKTLVDAGVWSDKKMPKSGNKFPLSRARGFRVGVTGWRWRVLQYQDDQSRQYRLLVLYHPGKQQYVAALGTPVGTDLLVLGVLEYHATHPGWHMHAPCKLPPTHNSGRLRYPEMKRVQGRIGQNALQPFPTTDGAALEIAVRYLKLPPLVDIGTQLPFPLSPLTQD